MLRRVSSDQVQSRPVVSSLSRLSQGLFINPKMKRYNYPVELSHDKSG
jgi:hypothetical protein